MAKKKANEAVVSVLDDEMLVEEDSQEQPETPQIAYKSEQWNDYVMSLFQPSEKINDNPTCAGLRRVAELVLGDIYDSGPTEIHPAMDPNGPGRATVVFQVIFVDWMHTGQTRVFREVADVWHGNTDDLFAAYPVATASTRAEGRALRKALGIKCLAAEEVTTNKDVASIVKSVVKESPAVIEMSDDDKITSAQLNFIDKKCGSLNIDVLKFVEMWSLSTLKQKLTINELSKKNASQLLGLLNDYQNNSNQVSESIKGYVKNWRKE